jgi:RHS repeat-associated protein
MRKLILLSLLPFATMARAQLCLFADIIPPKLLAGGVLNPFFTSLQVGKPFSVTFTSSTPGAVITVDPSPVPGLTTNGTTVSGKPTQAGSWTADTTAMTKGSDGSMCYNTFHYHYDVAGAPPITVTGNLPSGTVGVTYTGGFAASGGSGDYTFHIAGLPQGLLATGANVSGTPQAPGVFPITVTIDDNGQGGLGSAEFSLTIAAPGVAPGASLSLTLIVPQSAKVGEVVVGKASAAGGTPPYITTLSGLSGALIDRDGNLTFTPNASGSFPYVAIVTDANKATATANGSITVTLPSAPAGGCPDVSYISLLDETSRTFYHAFDYDPFRLDPVSTNSRETFGNLRDAPPGSSLTLDGIFNVPPGGQPGAYKPTWQCANLDGGPPMTFTVDIHILPAPSPFGASIPTADPIQTATGEISDRQRVLALGGPLPLHLDLFYSSVLGASGFSGAMSNNWMNNFEATLVLNGTQGATITLMGGKTIRFVFAGNAWILLTPEPNGYQLASVGNTYQLLDPTTQWTYTFSNAGALTGIEDRNGNALAITQGPFGPTSISDGLGRTLTFVYGSSHLLSVTDQAGRSVKFDYPQGSLTSITDANGAVTNYNYTTLTGLPNGLPAMTNMLTAKMRPMGNTPYTETYDPLGHVASQTDSQGNKTSLIYNNASHITTVTDPRGNQEFDTTLDLVATTQSTDAKGNSILFGYDSNFRRTSVTDRLGNLTNVKYDPATGYPVSITDSQGAVNTLKYTPQIQGPFTYYNLTGIQYADGTSASFTYDVSGNVLTATDQAGKTVTYTYNSRGQVLTATNPLGGVTTITYNSDATVASIQNPAGNLTAYTYDTARRVTKTAFADGTSASFTYDGGDRPLSATDERGNTVKLTWDSNGNLLSVTDPLSKSASAKYDTDDLTSSRTDRAGNTTAYQYDALGNRTAVTDGAGDRFTFSYDALNRLVASADSSSKGSTFAYDNEGRLVSSTDAVGNTANLTRDSLGRVVRAASPLGEVFSLAYNPLGRLTSVTDPLAQTSAFTYDPRGLLAGVTAPGGLSASYARDALGLLTALTDPNGNVWARKNDNLGRLTSETDPLGRTTTYSYDARNRVKSAANPAGSVQVAYDAAGNLTQSKFSDGMALNYTYDQNNRVTAGGVSLGYDAAGRINSSNGLTVARNGAGRIAAITYATGKTVTYTYDSRGLLSKIADWAGGSVSLAWDAARRLASISRSNGVTTQYTYDQNSRVLSITEKTSNASLSSIALERDPLGRVTDATRSLPGSLALASGTLGLAYDAAHQVSGSTYDGLGRLTQDSSRTYTWDLASRMTGYSGKDGSAAFGYDDFGARTSRTVGGATENYVINYALGLPSIATVKSSGADSRYYVHLPDGSVLYAIDASGNARHWYHFDEAGSTAFLTSDSGAITDTYGVSPYGETVTQSGSTPNPFTWQGQFGVMQEGSTGLYYMRARYYDSATARFLSQDPVRSAAPAEIDPYQYALGDPQTLRDPRGLKTEQPIAVIPTTGASCSFSQTFSIAVNEEYLDLFRRHRPAALTRASPLPARGAKGSDAFFTDYSGDCFEGFIDGGFDFGQMSTDGCLGHCPLCGTSIIKGVSDGPLGHCPNCERLHPQAEVFGEIDPDGCLGHCPLCGTSIVKGVSDGPLGHCPNCERLHPQVDVFASDSIDYIAAAGGIDAIQAVLEDESEHIFSCVAGASRNYGTTFSYYPGQVQLTDRLIAPCTGGRK